MTYQEAEEIRKKNIDLINKKPIYTHNDEVLEIIDLIIHPDISNIGIVFKQVDFDFPKKYNINNHPDYPYTVYLIFNVNGAFGVMDIEDHEKLFSKFA